MLAYWLLFILPVLAMLQPFRCDVHLRRFGFILFGIVATLMIGLRYEVGGDWGAYLRYVEMAKGIGLLQAMAIHDPGYMVINWLAANAGLGIAGVNLIGGGLFIFGLLRFSGQQPLPLLGVVVAIPFLLIVVGMGYSRQAIALGIVLWAFSTWGQKNFIKYTSLIFFAALFHKSAIVLFLLGLFINKHNLIAKWLLIVPLLVVISLILFINDSFKSQFNTYVIAQSYHSEGALVRVLMNGIPAIILLLLNKQFKQFEDYRLWQLVSLASLLSIPAAMILSTFTDRFALYLAPLQMVVYCRLATIMRDDLCRSFVIFITIITYTIVLFVWLNYASHAKYWIPYSWIMSA